MVTECALVDSSVESIKREYHKQTLLEIQTMDITDLEPEEAMSEARQLARPKVVTKYSDRISKLLDCLDEETQ